MNSFEFYNQNPDQIKTGAEKRDIRRTAMYVGIAMLCTAAVSLFWATIYINVMSLFGIDSMTALDFARQPAVNQLINMFLSVIIFTLPFFIILSGCEGKLADTVPFKKPKGKNLLPIILFAVAFSVFGNLANSKILSFLGGFGIYPRDPMGEMPEGFFGRGITVLSVCFLAPLIEEFAMRGILLGSLRKYGEGFAILASATMFGLCHGNFVQIPFAFALGIIIGFAVIKTESIWTGIIIHFINNSLSVALSFMTENLSYTESAIITLIYFAVMLLAGFVGVLLFKGIAKEELSLDRGNNLLTEGKMGKIFFSSPFIIAYIVVIFGMSTINI